MARAEMVVWEGAEGGEREQSPPNPSGPFRSGAAAPRGFVQLPNAVLFDKQLSPGQLKVYAMLLHHARQSGRCWPGQKVLADEVGMTTRGLRKCLEGLRAAGYIESRRRFATSNIYEIQDVSALIGAQQSGTTGPHDQELEVRIVRNSRSVSLGTGVPTEGETEETAAGEKDAEEEEAVPPSAGRSPYGQSPAPPPPPFPILAASPPLGAGEAVEASPQQRSLIQPPPVSPPRADDSRRGHRPAAKGPSNWVAAFSAVHRERCGGDFPSFAAAGKALKPLREQHEHAPLLAAWRRYVAATPIEYISARSFAAKPNRWLVEAGVPVDAIVASAPKFEREEPPKTRQEAIDRLLRGRRVA